MIALRDKLLRGPGRDRPVRAGHGTGDLTHRRDLQRPRDDPARHLQLHGDDLRSRRTGGGQVAALDQFGSGTTGSRVLNGTYAPHIAMSRPALREFYAMDHAMVFSTGYQANLGIISTIAGKGDYIVLDIDSATPAIWDGCKLGDAEVVPFKHNDIVADGKAPQAASPKARASWSSSKASTPCSAISPRLKEMIAVAKAAMAQWCWWTKRIRWASSAPTAAASPRTRGCLDDVDFVIGTFSKIGRHGRRLLRLQPPQVRNHAAWPAGPMYSPPACPPAWSPPPRPASAS